MCGQPTLIPALPLPAIPPRKRDEPADRTALTPSEQLVARMVQMGLEEVFWDEHAVAWTNYCVQSLVRLNTCYVLATRAAQLADSLGQQARAVAAELEQSRSVPRNIVCG